mgnify:CR=1 FL=1
MRPAPLLCQQDQQRSHRRDRLSLNPARDKCLLLYQMSGLISSLIIEPVFRQARRFSRHTGPEFSPSPSDDGRADVHSSGPSSVSYSSPSEADNNNGAFVADAQENFERRARSRQEGSSDNGERYPDIDASLQMSRERPVSEPKAPSNCDAPMEPVNYNDFTLESNISSQESGSRRPTDSSHEQGSIQGSHLAPEDARPLGQSFNWDELGQSPLPEDDGMGVLRRKIHAIRDTEASNAEKARLIHNLMTEGYNSSQSSLNNQSSSMARSPSSLRSLERSCTPASHRSRQSFDRLSITSASTVSVTHATNPYNITPEDLKPTFVPKEDPQISLSSHSSLPEDIDEDESLEEEEEAALGCRHYKRNVKLQCYDCKRWYTCRFCHDEVEDHSLNRRKTENMLCMLCGRAQPAAQWCKGCGEQAARYYCTICKLWDDDNKKSIYHCNDCGICRIGQGLGKDFFHCKVKVDGTCLFCPLLI